MFDNSGDPGSLIEAACLTLPVPISIVEILNNGRQRMATMNFSIPDDVKEAFNKAFEGENNSAVVASLLRKAVEDRERNQRSVDLVERLRRIRARSRPVSDEEIVRARQELRE
jgi:hypothetical protein